MHSLKEAALRLQPPHINYLSYSTNHLLSCDICILGSTHNRVKNYCGSTEAVYNILWFRSGLDLWQTTDHKQSVPIPFLDFQLVKQRKVFVLGYLINAFLLLRGKTSPGNARQYKWMGFRMLARKSRA